MDSLSIVKFLLLFTWIFAMLACSRYGMSYATDKDPRALGFCIIFGLMAIVVGTGAAVSLGVQLALEKAH